MNSSTYHTGIGLETYRASVQSLCQAGLCDVAILVDSSSGERSTLTESIYSNFKKWVVDVNAEVNVVRMSPLNLRIDEDMMDSLFDLMQKDQNSSERSATLATRYNPFHFYNSTMKEFKMSKVRLSYKPEIDKFPTGLYSFRIPVPSQAWSLQSVLTVLKFLFPLASISCPIVFLSRTWYPNCNNSYYERGFKRLIDLAKTKIFSNKRYEEERIVLEENLSKYKNKSSKLKISKDTNVTDATSDISKLRVGLLAVSGVISLGYQGLSSFGDGTYGQKNHKLYGVCVNIEACAGSIIIRESEIYHTDNGTGKIDSQGHGPGHGPGQGPAGHGPGPGHGQGPAGQGPGQGSGQGSGPGQCLIVNGSFVEATKDLLLDIFQSAGFLHLKSKPLLTHSTVTLKMMEKVQLKYCGMNNEFRDLPGGCWFDGNVYVDINGNQRRFRPDIDDILEKYFIEENKKIEDYNALFKNLQFYL